MSVAGADAKYDNPRLLDEKDYAIALDPNATDLADSAVPACVGHRRVLT